MPAGWNLKVKSAYRFGSQKTTNAKGSLVSKLITTAIKQDVVAVAGVKISEKTKDFILEQNKRTVLQAAIFFQRVVTRTPKDERYYNPKTKKYHYPDKDFVWESWTAMYWRRSVTAKEMGSDLFEKETDFNNKQVINRIYEIMIERLFGGKQKFENRKTLIKSVRFANEHPRFAMLEYGLYGVGDSEPKEGPLHYHGVKNGYSIQAPVGMYRITQAELLSMTPEDVDRWISDKYRKKRKVDIYNAARIPSETEIKKLTNIVFEKKHLNKSDIKIISKMYDKDDTGGGEE